MIHLLKLELNPNRVYGLDILRALAILFVVVGHGKFLLPGKFDIIHKVITFDGVSIFFVLSGFLIGGILIKLLYKKQASKSLLVEFWIRRWFRTLPNYFLILITLILLDFLFTKKLGFWLIAKYFIFSQNLFYQHPPFFPEAWSLSIEEWFYLLIPLFIFTLIIFLKFPMDRSFVFTALIVLILVTCFRFYRFMSIKVEDLTQWDLLYRKQVFTRLDSLMFGMIGAYFHFFHPDNWIKFRKTLFIFGLILFGITKTLAIFQVYPINGLYHCVFSFSVTSLATLFLLPFLSTLKHGKGQVFTFFTYISLISYSMYLVNLSIVHVWIIRNIDFQHLTDFAFFNYTIKYIFYWFLTITLSLLIYKYFEVPMMNLRDNPRIKKLVTT